MRSVDDIVHDALEGLTPPLRLGTFGILALGREPLPLPKRLAVGLIDDLDIDADLEASAGGRCLVRISAERDGDIRLVFRNGSPHHGACTRLGEKEINAYINTFLDKIRANGELKKITDKWMKAEQPPMPEKLEGVPFTAS